MTILIINILLIFIGLLTITITSMPTMVINLILLVPNPTSNWYTDGANTQVQTVLSGLSITDIHYAGNVNNIPKYQISVHVTQVGSEPPKPKEALCLLYSQPNPAKDRWTSDSLEQYLIK